VTAATGGGAMASGNVPFLSLSLSILRNEQRKNEANGEFYKRMSDGFFRRNIQKILNFPSINSGQKNFKL